jgi:Zn-dependent protease
MENINQDYIENIIFMLSIMLVPGLMAITCHEVSHGFVADKLGDKTARLMGRLTLNPLKHLDLIGTLAIFIIHIGWAKPVPVNFNNLRNPKRDMIWVAAAGPVTNFILATVSALALNGLVAITFMVPGNPVFKMFIDPIIMMLAVSVYFNLILGIFNLIPVPPLDGGRVMVGLLPYRQSVAYAGIERYGMIGILLIVIFFPGVLSNILFPPVFFGIDLLIGSKAMLYLIHNTSMQRLGIF